VPGRASQLAHVAAAGAGRVLAPGDVATVVPVAAPRRTPLWPWALAAAAVLWVGDVARQTGMQPPRWRGRGARAALARRPETRQEDP
jgi:hypothetical protein